MNAVSQWWIGGLRTRKAKVAGSIPAGGSKMEPLKNACDSSAKLQYFMSYMKAMH
jgi:hypothetical protein